MFIPYQSLRENNVRLNNFNLYYPITHITQSWLLFPPISYLIAHGYKWFCP